jgi:hypothetical protein
MGKPFSQLNLTRFLLLAHGCASTAPRGSHVRYGSKADIRLAAIDVRFPPKSRHWRVTVGCPLSAMCGRLRVGKKNLHVAGWSVQPCVRPLDAVHMTAGHNALRGSGPSQ